MLIWLGLVFATCKGPCLTTRVDNITPKICQFSFSKVITLWNSTVFFFFFYDEWKVFTNETIVTKSLQWKLDPNQELQTSLLQNKIYRFFIIIIIYYFYIYNNWMIHLDILHSSIKKNYNFYFFLFFYSFYVKKHTVLFIVQLIAW